LRCWEKLGQRGKKKKKTFLPQLKREAQYSGLPQKEEQTDPRGGKRIKDSFGDRRMREPKRKSRKREAARLDVREKKGAVPNRIPQREGLRKKGRPSEKKGPMRPTPPNKQPGGLEPRTKAKSPTPKSARWL